MSQTQRALGAFSKAIDLSEESPALQHAREMAAQFPGDEMAQQRLAKLSAPAGYPDVHKAAVNFQNALMAGAKFGHTRGWQGGEQEAQMLQQLAQSQGVNPGLFVSPEGAGNSKREHLLHLTRLYGGKFLPGDGRSNLWDPMAHSFPDEESVQGFMDAASSHYPEMAQVQPQPVPVQVEAPDQSGQPIPQQQMMFNIPFTHELLGEPFPPGSQAYAMQTAQTRSASSPHPHFVVTDPQGGFTMTLEPDPQMGQQIVATFVDGQQMQVMPPEGEQGMQPGTEEQPPEQEQPQPEGGEQMDQPMDQQAGAQQPEPEQEPQQPPMEAKDDIDRVLHELGIGAHKPAPKKVVAESIDVADLDEILGLYKNSVRRAPALKMEDGIQVDSNRGITARGNNPHDRFASPDTREKVLRARMDEIQAFAESRKIPMATVYAATEASMRTGKVPDLGQYGLAGDDAVATKQFIISNVMNIQGLESVQDDGEKLEESHGTHGKHPANIGTLGNFPSKSAIPSPNDLDIVGDAKRYMKKISESVRGRGEPGTGGPLHRGGKYIGPESDYDSREGRAYKGARSDEKRAVTRKMRRLGKEATRNSQADDIANDLKQLQRQDAEERRAKAKNAAGIEAESRMIDPNRYMAENRRDYEDSEAYERRVMRDAPASESGRRAALNMRLRGMNPNSSREHQMHWSHYGEPHVPAWEGEQAKKKLERERAEREAKRRAAQDTQQDDISYDPSRYMAEEGGPYRTGGAPERASSSKAAPGLNALPQPNTGNQKKIDVLPKPIMAKLKKLMDGDVYGYTKKELVDIARGAGLIATEESRSYLRGSNLHESFSANDALADLDDDVLRLLGLTRAPIAEDDYQAQAKKMGGKFLGYVQPHQGLYEFKSEDAAKKFAGEMAASTTATPHVSGKRVSIDEPMLGESGHLGYAGTSNTRGVDSPHSLPVSEKPPTKRERTESEKILGIEEGDPRGESWPKMSDSVRKALKLESFDPFTKPMAINQPKQIEEATGGAFGSVGGYIKPLGGQSFGLLAGRTAPKAPYDASVDLTGDEENKQRQLADLLKDLGLKD